jgi:DNA mismatch repair protein MSH3
VSNGRCAPVQATCKQAWTNLLERFAPHCPAFRAAAHALATLDCLQSHAALAQCPNWCRPQFVDEERGSQIRIEGARSPLLDVILPGGAVPNDVAMGGDGLRMMVVSGPNMGGKSSYMCQVLRGFFWRALPLPFTLQQMTFI